MIFSKDSVIVIDHTALEAETSRVSLAKRDTWRLLRRSQFSLILAGNLENPRLFYVSFSSLPL